MYSGFESLESFECEVVCSGLFLCQKHKSIKHLLRILMIHPQSFYIRAYRKSSKNNCLLSVNKMLAVANYVSVLYEYTL